MVACPRRQQSGIRRESKTGRRCLQISELGTISWSVAASRTRTGSLMLTQSQKASVRRNSGIVYGPFGIDAAGDRQSDGNSRPVARDQRRLF